MTPAPAPAPAKVVAASPEPKPAAKPEPKPEASSGREKDVEASIRRWSNAWSNKDLKGYFASYGRDFNAGKSRKAWEEERRGRIMGKRNISIKISNLKIDVIGNKATASFRQDYRADGLSIGGSKQLEMVRQGNNWVIVKESAGS